MSRIGKTPVEIKAGVTLAINDGVVTVKGKLGELSYTLPEGIAAEVKDNQVIVTRASDIRQHKSFHGLARTLINNMIVGVTDGYKKTLDIEGVGFKAVIAGSTLSLSLGFASPKDYTIPAGVKVTEQGGVKITVEGIDKQLVGRVAADIRSYYPAEPYKGKGIRYTDEKIRRKEGKTVA